MSDLVGQGDGITIPPETGSLVSNPLSGSQVALEGAVQPTHVLILTGKLPVELRQAQLGDPTIGLILRSIEKGEQPEVQGQSREFRLLVQQWEQLEVKDGLLYRRYDKEADNSVWLQLVAPKCLREKILQELHGGVVSVHLGEEKTLGQQKERFYWPGHGKDVSNWCCTCSTCASRKNPTPKRRVELQTISPGYPLQIVAVDILGPLQESESGNSYILVAGDYFTRWMEAYVIPNQEASTVASKLMDEMFCRFSLPE